jgi:hypothetical protein
MIPQSSKLPLVLCLGLLLGTKAWAAQTVAQTVTISDPSNPALVGFNEGQGGLNWTTDNTKMLDLTISGGSTDIHNSQVVSTEGVMWNPPSDNPYCTTTKEWTTAPFVPSTEFRSFFQGEYCSSGGSGGSGSTPVWVDGVLMADLLFDSSNSSTALQRLPGSSDTTVDEKTKKIAPGLILGVNKGFQEGGDSDIKNLKEDFKNPGITFAHSAPGRFAADNLDPDLVKGTLTLKVPSEATTPPKVTVTYDTSKISMYMVDGNNYALIQSGTAYSFNPGAPSFNSATDGNLGSIYYFGPQNTIMIEGLKSSEGSGDGSIKVALTPANGSPSYDELTYTVAEIDAQRKAGDPATTMNTFAIVFPTRRLREHTGASITSILESDYPNYGWYAFVHDAAATGKSVNVTITAYDKDRNVVDTLTPTMKQATGGTYVSTDKLWLVIDQGINGSAVVSAPNRTLRARPDGIVVMEYYSASSKAIVRKELIPPHHEEFLYYGIAGLGSIIGPDGKPTKTSEIAAVWSLGNLLSKGSDPDWNLMDSGADFPDAGELTNTPAVASITQTATLDYFRSDLANAKMAVDAWMADDITNNQGSTRGLITGTNSWGARNGTDLSNYFATKYSFRPNITVQIAGIHYPFPFSWAHIGAGFTCKNYYVDEQYSNILPGERVVDANTAPNDNLGFSLTSKSSITEIVDSPAEALETSEYDPGSDTGVSLRYIYHHARQGNYWTRTTKVWTSNDEFYLWLRMSENYYWSFASAHISAEWAGGMKAYTVISKALSNPEISDHGWTPDNKNSK